MKAVSLFSGAGGMDVGFLAAGVQVLWANEYNGDAVETYKSNHPETNIVCEDIRKAKEQLKVFAPGEIDLVFGGPPCQGFSVAGKMDPEDERSTMIWEFFDVIEMLEPQIFVMENVKALGELARWQKVREKIKKRASKLGYKCFSRILNSADFGVPQKRERVFFIGIKNGSYFENIESDFDSAIERKQKPKRTLRDCLISIGKVGTTSNPQTCTAKITLPINPVIRKSPYAGMLFNGMGRPLNFDSQANTLPASMGGNKTPIVDELLLYNPNAQNWIVEHHKRLLSGEKSDEDTKVPDYFRRLTIKEAAAIQTFPADYVFCGGKSSIYRQIGNAVPCDLAKAIAQTILEIRDISKLASA